MLEAGATAPDFTLPDQNGNELSLADLRGETVVLYFYPRADTPIERLPRVAHPHGSTERIAGQVACRGDEMAAPTRGIPAAGERLLA